MKHSVQRCEKALNRQRYANTPIIIEAVQIFKNDFAITERPNGPTLTLNAINIKIALITQEMLVANAKPLIPITYATIVR